MGVGGMSLAHGALGEVVRQDSYWVLALLRFLAHAHTQTNQKAG